VPSKTYFLTVIQLWQDLRRSEYGSGVIFDAFFFSLKHSRKKEYKVEKRFTFFPYCSYGAYISIKKNPFIESSWKT
jgi:hypothetical protein